MVRRRSCRKEIWREILQEILQGDLEGTMEICQSSPSKKCQIQVIFFTNL